MSAMDASTIAAAATTANPTSAAAGMNHNHNTTTTSLLSSATEKETDAAKNLFNLVAPTGGGVVPPPSKPSATATAADAADTTATTDAAPTAAAPTNAAPAEGGGATMSGGTTTATSSSPTRPTTTTTKTRGRKKSRGLYPSFPLMLYKLMAFRCKYNHCRVTTEDDHALGSWVALVRRCHSEHKRGQRSNYLTAERVEILNSIGFTWSLLQCSNDKRWETNFSKLLEFRERNGHCNAPQSTPLGKWVQMQRDQYRELEIRKSGVDTRTRTRPMITQDRLERLNEVGFQWRVAVQAVGWEARYEELAEYKRLHGNCNVPQGYKPNVPLGRWVMKQRVQYHKLQRGQKSQIKPERIHKLEALGFQWVGPGAQRTGKKRKMSDRDDDDEDDADEHDVDDVVVEQEVAHHTQQQQQQHLHHPNQQPPYPPTAHYATYQQQAALPPPQQQQLQQQQQQPPPPQHAYGQPQPAQELEPPSPYYQSNWM